MPVSTSSNQLNIQFLTAVFSMNSNMNFTLLGNSRDRIAQETFVNCADVVITKQDGTLPGGMVMPKVPGQASRPIKEAVQKLGQGKLIGLPGKWDCVVPPPHGNTEKKNVFYGWCLENCLYANPRDR